MIPSTIIAKKRDGHALSEKDLSDFVQGYLGDKVSDAQMAAFLMAVTIKSMNFEETAYLTKLSRDSGFKFSWPQWRGKVVDKHSTGGIGDKTSMIILPLCLLSGLKVPMMAGRGLGHTGGTIDKLESIPGMHLRLSEAEIHHSMKMLGGVFMGQTEKIVPLDYRLYHLRDVTATVESIPLIVTSILSKKLAEGVDSLVMDIKFGSGAFMKTLESARELGEWLIKVGEQCEIKVRCVLSSMDSPLGKSAGNTLEILECLDVLRGEGPDDTKNLSLDLAAHMVQMSQPEKSLEEIKRDLEEYLKNGKAFDKFCEVVHMQGGDISFLKEKSKFQRAKIKFPVVSKSAGFVSQINVRELGHAIITLGGGRMHHDDKIDFSVGLSELAGVGKKIEPGKPFCIIEGNDWDKIHKAKDIVEKAYQFSDDSVEFNLIEEVLT